MRFIKFGFFIAVFFSFLSAGAGLAQEAAAGISVFDLGEIVVTPTRSQRPTGDLSAAVSVITREDIEASTANTATDILNILPGVFVHKTGPFGRTDVVIRGHGSRGRRVMVLIDGKPEKMGLFGCTITSSLPLDNVERIEVIRGSGSVLYGSDALGGVINIITRKPKREMEGDVSLSYGSYDTQIYRLRQGGDLDGFNYYFTFDERRTRGHLTNADYKHRHFTLRLGANLSDNLSATLTSRYFDNFERHPAPADPGSWSDYERGALDLTLNGKWDLLEAMLKVYRNFGEHIFSDGWHSKDYTAGVMLHANTPVLETNTLSLGAEFRQQGGKVVSAGGQKYRKDEWAFFIQDEQRLFNDSLIVSAGLRYNHDQLAGDILCPQAGLVYHIFAGTRIRANVSRGFRSPGLNELRFGSGANPDLKPEKSWNYEAGFSQQLTDTAHLDFTYFIIKAKNFIRRAPPWPPGLFGNVDELEFKGTETSLQWQILPELFSRLSYTYLKSGRYTQGRPESELGLSAMFKKEKFNVSLDGQWVDNYFENDNRQGRIPNFFVLNSKFTYKFNPDLESFVSVNNLLNTAHRVYVDLPPGSAGVFTQPKRNFGLGLNYKW